MANDPGNGVQLALRVSVVLALATLAFVLAAASSAGATPITPTVKQLLKQAQKPPLYFVPARAGWNGPLVAKADPQTGAVPEDFNQLLDQAALIRATRRQLKLMAVPDPRIVVGLAMLIFLLRRWRALHPGAGRPGEVVSFPPTGAAPAAAPSLPQAA